MKFKEIFTEDASTIKLIEKFIKGFDSPSRSPEDKYYDYSNGKVHITNTYEAKLQYSDIVKGLNTDKSVVTLKVSEMYSEVISTKEHISNRVVVRIQVGYNSDGVIKSETVTTITAASIKKAYKAVLAKLKKDNGAQVKILSDILNSRKPLSKKEAQKSTSMGHASMSSTIIQHSYEDVVDISDLMKVFSEKQFKEAKATDFSLKRNKITFNFEDGLMDKSGTWSETWD